MLRWSRRFGGFSVDAGEGIAVDVSGNVFVTGLVSAATVDFGTGPLLARGGADAFLVRLAP
jgi:hypothetical protein